MAWIDDIGGSTDQGRSYNWAGVDQGSDSNSIVIDSYTGFTGYYNTNQQRELEGARIARPGWGSITRVELKLQRPDWAHQFLDLYESAAADSPEAVNDLLAQYPQAELVDGDIAPVDAQGLGAVNTWLQTSSVKQLHIVCEDDRPLARPWLESFFSSMEYRGTLYLELTQRTQGTLERVEHDRTLLWIIDCVKDLNLAGVDFNNRQGDTDIGVYTPVIHPRSRTPVPYPWQYHKLNYAV